MEEINAFNANVPAILGFIFSIFSIVALSALGICYIIYGAYFICSSIKDILKSKCDRRI